VFNYCVKNDTSIILFNVRIVWNLDPCQINIALLDSDKKIGILSPVRKKGVLPVPEVWYEKYSSVNLFSCSEINVLC
jgi:hypothetical protein